MPKQTLKIESIEGGLALTTYGPAQKNSYDGAFGIDPDFRSAISSKTGGAITPAAYAKFSGNSLATDSVPNWIITTPKDSTSYIYAYCTGGEFLRYTYTGTSFGTETALTEPTSGAGNGMAYYNNYIYLTTPTQVFRYGPLSGAAALSNALIANGELLDGWAAGADTLLNNTTFPTFNNAGAVVSMPNHAMHVHTDGFLYVCDVISTSYATTAVQGKGVLHRISTSKTTADGDTNNGSAYNVLELPFGWYPVAIESWGTDLAILAMPGTSLTTLTLSRGNAALFLWDTFASIPYKQIPLPDPIASAIKNVNGRLMIWSGNTTQGVRISTYNGGEGVSQVALLADSFTPGQGNVGAFGDKAFFGGFVSYPAPILAQQACVYTIDSKISQLPQSAIHVPAVTSNGSSHPIATALGVLLMDNMVRPTAVFGYGDTSTTGIANYKTGNTQFAYFRMRWEVGRPFSVRSVRISLDQAITSGVVITPTVYVDNNSSSQILTVANNTNNPGETVIAWKRPEVALVGQENITLQLAFTGTVAASVVFPVEVEIDVFDVVKTG